MAEFGAQLEEIETLISQPNNKAVGYSSLLNLQEQSTQHPQAIEAMSKRICSLVPCAVADISDEDEEISSQALKCLGFMIYHPSLVASVTEDVAQLVVESLVKLITTTKLKAVRNLAVWCISIQQINVLFLSPHFHSLLKAVIHALDNPSGSLSTSFEAIQAVIKLVAQLSEKMREASSIWLPVIYRRLLSSDKRERDMTERCLLKIKSVILPPPLALSKVLVADMKKKLLPEMMEGIQDHGRKIHIIQAWGWYIRLLGSYAMKNRQLVNDMLKVPEHTFSDSDPQVQIASQNAWEGLIDALINPSVEASGRKMDLGHVAQERSSMTLNKCNYENRAEGLSKSLRLIMTPLVGIMSSKCDITVRSSCLNTWCYLLHKLDLLVNCPSVMKAVVEPILEAVFQMGADDKSIWLWNVCLDLLDDFISSNHRGDNELRQQMSLHSSSRTSLLGPKKGAKCYLKDYPINWMPWDLSKLDFHIKMIGILISQGSVATLSLECRNMACNAVLRAFRSLLKGIQNELRKPSTSYSEIILCLQTILSLTKEMCEDATSKELSDLLSTSLQFIEAIRQELETSLLTSPLYKVALNFKYIRDIRSVVNTECPEVPEMRSIDFMSMVPPTVYLTIAYLCMIAQSFSNPSQMEIILHGLEKHLKFILSSYNSLDNLYAITNFIYKHKELAWLQIWAMIANALKEHLDVKNISSLKSVKDIPSLKVEMDSDGYMAACWFLSYPFTVCLSLRQPEAPVKSSCPSNLSLGFSSMELQDIVVIWKAVYDSFNCCAQFDCSTITDFPVNLCGIISKVFNEKIGAPDPIFQNLFGEVAIHLLNQYSVFNNEVLISKEIYGDCFQSSGIKNILEFVARYLKLAVPSIVCDHQADQSGTSGVFSALAHFVRRLHLKHHILLLLEIFCDPLVEWLSTCAPMHEDMQEGSIIDQLHHFWTGIMDSCEKSQPAIIFDSSFLKVQAPVLEKTIDHPYSAISESTISFWNHTYGNQVRLEYPQSLVPILDKLSRNGKISIHKRCPPTIPSRYRVASTQNNVSKRIGLTEDTRNGVENTDTLVPGLKRKRRELTEHQKEVRRAQQGRERDCSGHGPGVRTYTSVDFSQGNEDSQEDSQELRNPETILEMLKKGL